MCHFLVASPTQCAPQQIRDLDPGLSDSKAMPSPLYQPTSLRSRAQARGGSERSPEEPAQVTLCSDGSQGSLPTGPHRARAESAAMSQLRAESFGSSPACPLPSCPHTPTPLQSVIWKHLQFPNRSFRSLLLCLWPHSCHSSFFAQLTPTFSCRQHARILLAS